MQNSSGKGWAYSASKFTTEVTWLPVKKASRNELLVLSTVLRTHYRYADDLRYEAIVFLRLNADENPVARKMMPDKEALFFATCCQGRLLECDALTSETEVIAQLDRLQAFQPVGH